MNSLFEQPTLEYCEKAGTGLIKRPFYALGNLAYLLVGVIILRDGRGSKLSKMFGWFAILIALLSFLYDASYTYLSQLFDLTGMLIFINMLIYLDLQRFLPYSSKKILISQFVIAFLGLFIIINAKGYAGDIVFGIFVLTAVISEIILFWRKTYTHLKLWLGGFGIFIIGFMFWLLDATGIFCDPSNILNGRTIFHIFTAITIYILYQFHKEQ